MKTLRDIKGRIRTIAKIEQMTTAMQRIASARLARAFAKAASLGPYAAGLRSAMGILAGGMPACAPAPGRPSSPTCLVILTSEKGLCGAFNNDTLREAKRAIAGFPAPPTLVLVGAKGRSLLRREEWPIDAFFPQPPLAGLGAWAQAAADWLLPRWAAGNWGCVELIHGRLRSEVSSEPVRTALLPVAPSDSPPGAPEACRLFEPAAGAQFESLLPEYVTAGLQRAMIEAMCAEQVSRMLAMMEAARNARTMLEALHQQLNRARQALITGQIIETSEAVSQAVEAAAR